MLDYEKKYKSLLGLSSDGFIIYNPNGDILDFNEGACQYIGYSEEELKKLRLTDLVSEDDIEKRPISFDKLQEGRRLHDYRKIKRKDGSYFLAEINTIMLPDGNMMALARDITEKAKVEQDLQLKEHAIASSISGMAITDLDGKLIYTNKALCRMWGCTGHNVLQGKMIADIFSGCSVFDAMEVVREKGIEYGECTAKRFDGSLFPVAFSANAVTDKKGKPLCLFGSFIDISEQKKARYLSDSIIDNLPGIFFMYDVAEEKIIRWNKRVADITGYTSREIDDMKFWEFICEKDRDVAEQKIGEAIYNGKAEAEICLVTKQSVTHPFYFTGFLVTLVDKSFLIVNGIDISERKNAEKNLRRKYGQLQLLANLTDAVSRARQLGDIYELALNGLRTTINADKAAVLLFNDEGIMQFKASYDLSESYKQAASGHSPWKADAKNPEPIFIADAEEAEELKTLLPAICKEGIRALGFIPLVYMNRLLGKFMIYFNAIHDFTEEESQLAQTIAREVAFAIGEKENKLALRKSEQQYRDVIHNTKEIIFQTDTEGRWIFLNPAWTDILGYSVEESIGKKFQSYVFPDDIPECEKKLEELLTGKTPYCRHELRYVTKMNTICWMEVNARLISDSNNSIAGTAGLLNDITERKKASELIIKEKELSDSIINTLPGIFYIYDDAGKFYRWNKNLETVTGYSAGEISGMHPLQFFDTDEQEYMAERSKATFIFGKADAESYFYTKNKSKIPYYFNCVAITYEGRPCSMGMGIDIAERKKAEADIAQTTRQLRELSAHLQDVREEERAAMAREIHDELGQQLTVLKIDFSWLESKLKVEDDPARKKITDIKNLLDKAVKTIRRLSSELRPSLLDDLGLIATIEWYLEDFSKRSNIKTEFRHSLETLIVPDKIKTALFRIFQESITNIIRHANASAVVVTLTKEGDDIMLQIADNGKGFDMADVSGKKTLGLLGMRERSLLMGGDCRIEGYPGEGATVNVSLSLSSLVKAV